MANPFLNKAVNRRNPFLNKVEEPIERLPVRPPVPDAGEGNTFANSPEFKSLINRAIDDPESLTDAQNKQIQAGRENFPDIDAFMGEFLPAVSTDVSTQSEEGPSPPVLEELGGGSLSALVDPAVELLDLTRQAIAKTGREFSENIEELNESINRKFPSVPVDQLSFKDRTVSDLVSRLVLRGITGIAGFVGGAIPAALDPKEIVPEGTENPTLQVANDFAGGIVDLVQRAVITADELASLVIEPATSGNLTSPIKALAKDGFFSNLSEEQRTQIIQDAVDRPDEPLFGLLIASGAVRSILKSRVNPATRLAEAIGGEVKLEIGDQSKLPFQEDVGKTEKLVETKKTEKPLTENQEKIIRAEEDVARLERINDRLRENGGTPDQIRVTAEQLEKAKLDEAKQKAIPEIAEKKTEIKKEVTSKAESLANELGIKFDGEQELPKNKSAFAFTDPKTSGSFIVKDLANLPDKLKSVRSSFEKATDAKADRFDKVVGLSKTENNRLRDDLGLNKLPEVKRQAMLEVLNDAKSRGIDVVADDIAREVLKNRRPLSTVEEAGMGLRVSELVNKYEESIKKGGELVGDNDLAAAQIEKGKAESILDNIEMISDAIDIGGTETARALAFRRIRINRENFSLVNVIQRARTNKGGKLSPEQNARFEGLVKGYTVLEDRVKSLETNNEKLLETKTYPQSQDVCNQ